VMRTAAGGFSLLRLAAARRADGDLVRAMTVGDTTASLRFRTARL